MVVDEVWLVVCLFVLWLGGWLVGEWVMCFIFFFPVFSSFSFLVFFSFFVLSSFFVQIFLFVGREGGKERRGGGRVCVLRVEFRGMA